MFCFPVELWVARETINQFGELNRLRCCALTAAAVLFGIPTDSNARS
jgi:hypothetical protein